MINFNRDSYQVGFDSGDPDGALNIVGGSPSVEYTGGLQGINVFRVDGN